MYHMQVERSPFVVVPCLHPLQFAIVFFKFTQFFFFFVKYRHEFCISSSPMRSTTGTRNNGRRSV